MSFWYNGEVDWRVRLTFWRLNLSQYESEKWCLNEKGFEYLINGALSSLSMENDRQLNECDKVWITGNCHIDQDNWQGPCENDCIFNRERSLPYALDALLLLYWAFTHWILWTVWNSCPSSPCLYSVGWGFVTHLLIWPRNPQMWKLRWNVVSLGNKHIKCFSCKGQYFVKVIGTPPG